MPKTTHTKTLTLTALALTTFFTTLTPATATDTPATDQAIEHLTQTGASVAEETNRLIVTLKDETTNKDVLAHDASALTDALDDATLVKDQVAGDTSTIVLETDTLLNEQEQKQTIAQLEADPRIESVTPDRLVRAISAAATTEPYYPRLWAFAASQMNAAPAWASGYTGAGQTIGLVDTGYSNHPDLRAPIASWDFVSSTALSNDGNGRDSDARDMGNNNANANWHGTFIYGQLAAQVNNIGVTGIAHGANVNVARAMGLYGWGYETDMADAIVWEAGGTVVGAPTNPAPATVINASFAWPSATCTPAMSKAINYALSKNIPVVVAAGNDGINANGVTPANCYRAIVVGASTSWGTLTAYSNWGSMLDVVAPGGTTGNDIFSTSNTGFSSIGSPTYGTKNGTSMAAPYVTGTIALMKQANPSLTVEQIRQILTSTGKNLAGYKLVDTGAAVARAAALAPAPQYKLVPGLGIEAAYWRYGGRSVFGAPTSNEFTSAGGVIQNFERGVLYWSAATGAHPVNFAGGIGARYAAGGFERAYGFPVFAETAITGGAMQKFRTVNGGYTAFYWTPTHHRTHTVWENGAIGGKFTREGGTGTYGFPSEDERAVANGARQTFVLGTNVTRFFWAPNTGVNLINGRGAINALWEANGGVNRHGFPATNEVAAGGGGVTQLFRTSTGAETVYTWSPSAGTHTLNGRGAIYWHWRNTGFTSLYGYPTSDETYTGNGVYQVNFSSGKTINWSSARGIWVS